MIRSVEIVQLCASADKLPAEFFSHPRASGRHPRESGDPETLLPALYSRLRRNDERGLA